jgi:GT2 family glycosyltransferase
VSEFIDTEGEYDIFSTNGYYWRPGESQSLVYDDEASRHIHSLELKDVIKVCFYGVGAAFRRDLFGQVGGYRTDVFGEDYDFWLRAMALGARHRYLPVPLSLFRLSGTQKSASLERMYRSDIRLYSDLRREFVLSPAEDAAVMASIRERQRLIAQFHVLWGIYPDLLRPVGKRVVSRLLGPERARRLWHRLTGVLRHGRTR